MIELGYILNLMLKRRKKAVLKCSCRKERKLNELEINGLNGLDCFMQPIY